MLQSWCKPRFHPSTEVCTDVCGLAHGGLPICVMLQSGYALRCCPARFLHEAAAGSKSSLASPKICWHFNARRAHAGITTMNDAGLLAVRANMVQAIPNSVCVCTQAWAAAIVQVTD
eukprot:530032-Pelagomonas_calceolata.AAC.4